MTYRVEIVKIKAGQPATCSEFDTDSDMASVRRAAVDGIKDAMEPLTVCKATIYRLTRWGYDTVGALYQMRPDEDVIWTAYDGWDFVCNPDGTLGDAVVL